MPWSRLDLYAAEDGGDFPHQGIPQPVRAALKVMNDAHMHGRGMLAHSEHPKFGKIVVPGTTLRSHGADPVEAGPSPTIGRHNAEIYGRWLGLSSDETAELKENGVV